jgi:hypothetical protein
MHCKSNVRFLQEEHLLRSLLQYHRLRLEAPRRFSQSRERNALKIQNIATVGQERIFNVFPGKDAPDIVAKVQLCFAMLLS